jgi:chromosome segregation ATPase
MEFSPPKTEPIGMLETLLSNQEKILSDVAELKTDVAKLDAGYNSLCKVVEALQSDVMEIKTTLNGDSESEPSSE